MRTAGRATVFLTGFVVSLLLAGGCPASTDPTDTADSDATCDPIPRSDFATQGGQLCAFYMACEEPPFESQAACLDHLQVSWDSQGCWDDCLAWECSEWLASEPSCVSANDDVLRACLDMPACN